MSDRTPQIGGYVLTQCSTTLGPVGTGPGTQTPPLGTLLSSDSAPDIIYQWGRWLSATVGAAGYFICTSYAGTIASYPQFDKAGAASTGIDSMAGVLMGAPTQNQYCWVQKQGLTAALLIEGTVNLVKGDSIKGVSGQFYGVHDQAIGTVPGFNNYARALVAYSAGAGTATLSGAYLNCLRG